MFRTFSLWLLILSTCITPGRALASPAKAPLSPYEQKSRWYIKNPQLKSGNGYKYYKRAMLDYYDQDISIEGTGFLKYILLVTILKHPTGSQLDKTLDICRDLAYNSKEVFLARQHDRYFDTFDNVPQEDKLPLKKTYFKDGLMTQQQSANFVADGIEVLLATTAAATDIATSEHCPRYRDRAQKYLGIEFLP